MDAYEMYKKSLHDRSNFMEVEAAARSLLEALGVDLDDQNFAETPRRIAQVMCHFTSSVRNWKDVSNSILTARTFPTEYEQMVVVAGITANSLCPHHFLPVQYRVDVGYITTKGRDIVGLDKIPRVVRYIALQPVLQETFTHYIADVLGSALDVQGLGIVVTGTHGCIECRGVEQRIPVTTNHMQGALLHVPSARAEFFAAINDPRNAHA